MPASKIVSEGSGKRPSGNDSVPFLLQKYGIDATFPEIAADAIISSRASIVFVRAFEMADIEWMIAAEGHAARLLCHNGSNVTSVICFLEYRPYRKLGGRVI